MSCASCHQPARAWSDGLPRAIGRAGLVLGRRTPTIVNLAWGDRLFWDGRAGSLEEQALGPIQAHGEMDLPLAQATARLQRIHGYRDLFSRAYPGDGIAPASIAKAIATFEQPPGTSAEYAFAKPGVAEVQCAFHPKMKLIITVKK
jgi:cytochrome c peroxidase